MVQFVALLGVNGCGGGFGGVGPSESHVQHLGLGEQFGEQQGNLCG
jgi:hypothetical protein